MIENKLALLAIPLLPLLGAILAGFFGRKSGRTFAHSVTIFCVAAAFTMSWFVWRDVQAGKSFNGPIYTWLVTQGINLQIGFLVDSLTVMMMLVVTFVSLMVHVYTIGYMAEDDGYTRFFSYISLFTFSMLMLVMSNNFLQLFFGWEAVGLVSYLLIGFWYTRPTAIYANLKAFLVNRVGDFGFLLGIGFIFALVRLARLRHRVQSRAEFCRCDDRSDSRHAMVAHHRDLHLSVYRRDGQVRAISIARVAARLDGRPDTDLGADPRGHDGDGRHLHGRAHVAAV